MGIRIRHDHYFHAGEDFSELKALLIVNNENQLQIMALIDDLKQKVADLQASVDQEQAQIQQLLDTNAAVVTDLNTQIAALQQQVADGATPDQLNEVIASLESTKADIEQTVADVSPQPGDGTTQPVDGTQPGGTTPTT